MRIEKLKKIMSTVAKEEGFYKYQWILCPWICRTISELILKVLVRKEHIFIMDGYGGGKHVTIDFDKGRIVATLRYSYEDFNWIKR